MTKRREAKTVLIIEDKDKISSFACQVFELEAYRILEAEGNNGGVGLARENRRALVLLDLKLPKGDG